jgi:hypothetical protein
MRCLVLLAALAAGLAACGDTEPPAGDRCTEARDGRLTLVADDLRWDTGCWQAPAGRLTIVVDNRDDGQKHNVHASDAPGSPATDLDEGPSTQELDVDLEAGRYELICDLHPNMVGTLTVGATNPDP